MLLSNHVKIMGILNVTRDSFSDGGCFNSLDKARSRVESMIQEGVDIIDVGGESTRPGSERISLDMELDRVVPIIEMIKKEFSISVSIDTYKSMVALECLKIGADIINDISGFSFDPDMINVVSRFKPTCIVMHIKGTPENMQLSPQYDDVFIEVQDFLLKQADLLKNNGIKNIILDPGFGFGKSLDDNYILLKKIKQFSDSGYAVLAGISRKSMIGKVYQSEPVDRLPGTVALHTIAILNGASIIRVHDVQEAVQGVRVVEKYLEYN